MGASTSASERRRAPRVSVHGSIVLHGGRHRLARGTLENLSRTGALVRIAEDVAEVVAASGGDARTGGLVAPGAALDVELKLGEEGARVAARAVRVERSAAADRMAVVFENVDARSAWSIDAAIAAAQHAARRRPVLVMDEPGARREEIVARLAHRGMAPLVPGTPLDALDLLASIRPHVSVCLVGRRFGLAPASLHALVEESFPWLVVVEIDDDLDRVIDATARCFPAAAADAAGA